MKKDKWMIRQREKRDANLPWLNRIDDIIQIGQVFKVKYDDRFIVRHLLI